MKSNRPYFIWDYDLSANDLRLMLKSGSDQEKCWVLTRLLESARLNDVWSYASYGQVRDYFPRLKLKPVVRVAWEEAFRIWDQANSVGTKITI